MIARDYTSDPNQFDAARVAILVIATFASADCDRSKALHGLYTWLQAYQTALPNPTKKQLKDIKKAGKKQLTSLIKTGHCSNEGFQEIFDAEPAQTRALCMIMTAVRWPEWYIYPESYLHQIADEMDEHLSEINAITYYDEDGKRICPYDPAGLVNDADLYGTMRAQSKAIEDYCWQNHISSNITVEDVIRELEQFRADITSPLFQPDEYERGFVRVVRELRRRAPQIAADMMLYKSGNATAHMFGLSESRSVISDDPAIMKSLKMLGWSKDSCPNVLANLFHLSYPTLGLKPQPGQINCPNVNGECFDVAAGLGPALKIRYVFNIAIEVQNFLSFLSKEIKDLDERYDYSQEAYVNQMKGFREQMPLIQDAYCVDSTGYSDYLFRGVYRYLLELYGLPQECIDDIMTVFGFPLKIKGKLYPVKFGAMQGCKLLVFIMNHANRLFGIIARRLGAAIDWRHNAGDDVTSISYSKFEQKDMMIELKVFAMFNCAINYEKTAWLQQDGYFDFCSKYFYMHNGHLEGISGIPPKLVGKEMLSIKSFTEIFRVLKVSCVERNPIRDIWPIAFKLLRPEFELGTELPNAIGEDLTVDQKVKLALDLPFMLGGLCEDGEIAVEDQAKHACIVLERLLNNYHFRAEGVFRVLQNLEDVKGTELYIALGSVQRQGIAKIVECIEVMSRARDREAVTPEELESAVEYVSKLDRCIIKGISVSNTSSTYHRVTAKRDIDTFITDLDKPTELVDSVSKPSDMIEMALLLEAASQSSFTDVDQLRIYIQCQQALARVGDRLYQRTYGCYTNWYITDDDGKDVKLTTAKRDIGCNRLGNFKAKDNIINPDVKLIAFYLDGQSQALHDLQYVINGYLSSRSWRARFRPLLKNIQRDYQESCKRAITKQMQKQLEEVLIHNFNPLSKGTF